MCVCVRRGRSRNEQNARPVHAIPQRFKHTHTLARSTNTVPRGVRACTAVIFQTQSAHARRPRFHAMKLGPDIIYNIIIIIIPRRRYTAVSAAAAVYELDIIIIYNIMLGSRPTTPRSGHTSHARTRGRASPASKLAEASYQFVRRSSACANSIIYYYITRPRPGTYRAHSLRAWYIPRIMMIFFFIFYAHVVSDRRRRRGDYRNPPAQ